jgi:alkylmercury lyase
MNQCSLDLLATQLAAHLDCTQDVACRQILQVIAQSGQPFAPASLAACLQMSQEDLSTHLACISDTEFDKEGWIVGWGITLVPTQHQLVLP